MFNKDLLLFDIEATGINVTKHEVIQLAAILLDKKTLKEKKRFDMFIKPKRWTNREREAMAVNNITWDKLKDAKDAKTVLRAFVKTFGPDVIPATYGGNLDIIFFPAMFRDAGLKYPFDYHTYNFWPLAYTYMAKRKKLKNKKRFAGFTLEELGKDLGVKEVDGRHSALVDCEYEANILRKLLTKF